eukprot:Gregarina_sp_Poly_1__6162@NODE_3258_length_1233_cov_355_298456_g1029_i1_p1_GENE_NODE_3258_length_1233_cov_355_298456_g1029_i1NODE_3258_length_1233_cov_355_298456_g1029_i1_p1_ORF_typecomplete_len337_score44_99Aconitase_C/PF00694_19/7e44Aconitase_2_N/PF06434_13/3_3e02Aconitase_2_N/PF06434_13/0_049Glft2_N/PF17994_1/0_23_NODE_3258_length_1233_cov_355_298456_g1029_i11271011
MKPDLYKKVYSRILEGNDRWIKTQVSPTELYAWNENSTYIHKPPFFEEMQREPKPLEPIRKVYCLLSLGDSITTDHISPAGKIALNSPASQYLQSKGVDPKQFNSYGSRRGNDEVMARGTFANIRIKNKMVADIGPLTVHVPSQRQLPIFDAAQAYREAGKQCIVLAGSEYGSGSSRDWAAKGPMLQGVRAVIAVSFERIHRSNLVGMGILPLEFKPSYNAEALGISGLAEVFSINLDTVNVGGNVTVEVYDAKDQEVKKTTFDTTCRIDTDVELEYFKHGGILHYVLRKMASR